MEDKIKELIQNDIEQAGYILNNVVYEQENNTNFLRIMIDKSNDYININDCVVVNNIINPILDQIDLISENYIVDVCSCEKGSN